VNRALRAATVGVLLLSPVALSACGAGQVAQTATELRDKTGGRAEVGNLSLREVVLAYPEGGKYAPGADAELQMAVLNNGGEDDTLTRITGQGFSGAVFTDKSSAAASTASTTSASTSASVPTTPATATATPTATNPATATATTTAPAVTSAAPTTSASAPAPTSLTIPAGQTVYVGTGTTHITLTGLQSGLTTGQSVTLTLSFQKAGDVTLPVTVANPPTVLSHSSAYNFDQSGG
jgi:hypothetical protein